MNDCTNTITLWDSKPCLANPAHSGPYSFEFICVQEHLDDFSVTFSVLWSQSSVFTTEEISFHAVFKCFRRRRLGNERGTVKTRGVGWSNWWVCGCSSVVPGILFNSLQPNFVAAAIEGKIKTGFSTCAWKWTWLSTPSELVLLQLSWSFLHASWWRAFKKSSPFWIQLLICVQSLSVIFALTQSVILIKGLHYLI